MSSAENPADPSQYIEDGLESLGISDRREIRERAKSLGEDAANSAKMNRSPRVVAASSVYLAALLAEDAVSQEEVGDALGVSTGGIRDCYQEMVVDLMDSELPSEDTSEEAPEDEKGYPTPPEPLQSEAVEAQVIERKIWRRMWRQNEHFMGVIVGREGSAKSYSGLKIGETVDPTFDAERVMFDPVDFLKRLREWSDAGNTKGKVVVIDEAGVGVGVRTWHDEHQIRLNQVLQIIRDENMCVLFTLPRLEELDSQTRGRLHAYLEMTAKKQDKWAKIKWLDWDPTRDGRNKIYREYPEMTINGHRRKIKRLKLTPPSDELAEAYEERKRAFQQREYADAIDEMEEDVDDDLSVKEVAMEIADGALGDYVSVHSQNGTPYINASLIRSDYGLSQNDSSAVKSLLERQFSNEQLQEHV